MKVSSYVLKHFKDIRTHPSQAALSRITHARLRIWPEMRYACPSKRKRFNAMFFPVPSLSSLAEWLNSILFCHVFSSMSIRQWIFCANARTWRYIFWIWSKHYAYYLQYCLILIPIGKIQLSLWFFIMYL